MRTLVKVLVALVVVVPLGAYVAGSLAAVGVDDPAPHRTIVVRDSPTRSTPASAPASGRPSPSERTSPSGRPSPSDRPGEGGHGVPEVVTPTVHDLGDDHGGDHGGSGGSHGSDDSGGGGHG